MRSCSGFVWSLPVLLLAAPLLAAQSSFPVPPRPPEATERVRPATVRVRDWLVAGRVGEVERSIQEALAQKAVGRSGQLHAAAVVHRLFSGQSATRMQALLPPLDRWVAGSRSGPAASLALAFRGAFFSRAAWQARGGGWANTVSEASWAEVADHLNRARRDLDAAAAQDPTNPLPVWNIMSAARLLNLRQDAMEDYFQRALRYDRIFFAEPYAAKLAYLMPKWHGSEREMFAFARDALRQAPRGSTLPEILIQAHAEKARHLAASEHNYSSRVDVWAELQGTYQRLLEDFPRSGLWAVRFAGLAQRAGRLEDAAKYYDVALARDAEEPDVRYARGRFFETLQDVPRALAEYGEALRLDPSHQDTLVRRGRLLYYSRRLPEALADYSLLIDLDSDNARYYYMRATTYFAQKAYHEATRDYSRTIALKPSHKEAHQWRAATYGHLGMHEQQQRDLRRLKELKSEREEDERTGD